nr:Prenyltransferase and squalene oxidase repeat protein [Candidatus Prometheoarchaeum syntrophicum]
MKGYNRKGFRKMKQRHNILAFLFLSVLIISSFDYSVATSRKDLLEDFCISNQTATGGFMDFNNGTADTISEFTSYANLFILNEIDPNLEKIDKSKAEFWGIDRLNDFTSTTGTEKSIPDAYYALGILVYLNATANENSTLNDAITKMNGFYNETSHGYNGENSPISTLSDTYYAIEFLERAESLSYSTNSTEIASFVLSCWDSEDNAFAGSPGGYANPIDSYFAIQSLKRLDKLDLFNQKEELSDFIDEFYCDDPVFEAHNGGYSHTQNSPSSSSLMMTYYCVSLQNTLNSSKLHNETTLNWILSRQSPYDFGFNDYSSTSSIEYSSAKLSYFAIRSILIFEEDALGDRNSDLMNEELWNLSTSGWIIAGIVLICIGLAALAGYGIYRYKNRI